MTRSLGAILVALLSIALIGCEDTAITPTSEGTAAGPSATQARSDQLPDPASVLNGSASTAGPMRSKDTHEASSSGFSSPLFGLATAPNGDILVADAGAGIATLDGTTDIPLPGVADVSPLGRGSVWALKGLTGAPGDDTGQALYRATKGKNRLIADLFAFEAENNPDGEDLIDSNPFDVQSLGGRAALVADAGGNDLLRVDNRGNVEVLAVFPNEPVPTANIKDLVGCPESPSDTCELPEMVPAQAVPTSIAVGPDGHYYVGELKGLPAPTDESNIWKIAPDASGAECGSSPDCVKVFDGGFTSIIDLRFDDNGTLHVVELDENSWYALEIDPPKIAGGTVNACDLRAKSCAERASGIPILTAITFGKDGTLWATKNALVPGSATVEIP